MAESKTAKTYTADEADSPAYFQSGESWTCGADLVSVGIVSSSAKRVRLTDVLA